MKIGIIWTLLLVFTLIGCGNKNEKTVIDPENTKKIEMISSEVTSLYESAVDETKGIQESKEPVRLLVRKEYQGDYLKNIPEDSKLISKADEVIFYSAPLEISGQYGYFVLRQDGSTSQMYENDLNHMLGTTTVPVSAGVMVIELFPNGSDTFKIVYIDSEKCQELLVDKSARFPEVVPMRDKILINYRDYSKGRLLVYDLRTNKGEVITEYNFKINEDGTQTGDLIVYPGGNDHVIYYQEFHMKKELPEECGDIELVQYSLDEQKELARIPLKEYFISLTGNENFVITCPADPPGVGAIRKISESDSLEDIILLNDITCSNEMDLFYFLNPGELYFSGRTTGLYYYNNDSGDLLHWEDLSTDERIFQINDEGIWTYSRMGIYLYHN